MTAGQALGVGVVLGLAAAVPIGPVNVELARRTLTRGWAAGVALGLGAVSVDVAYAVLAVGLLGAGAAATGGVGEAAAAGGLAASPVVFWALAPASVLLLSYLGGLSLRAAWAAWRGADRLSGAMSAAGTTSRLGRTYLTGLAMTAVNPMTVVFWFVTLPGQAVTRGVESASLGYLAAGVFVGTVAWVLTFATALAALGRWRRPWWEAAADAVGGTLLLGFAALGVWAMAARVFAA
ncbi:MAG: LysE family transporter [Tepidisphaerales bacterium]